MNILAIDYGTKRLGLAWSDTTLGVVLPFGVVEQPSLAAKIKELKKILESEKIQKIVVGFPLSLKGGENANTARVQKFVFELQKITTAPVEYFDERFSSFGADAAGGGVSRDEKAAMFILEGYLGKNKKSR